jgi:hypothetical protein
MKTGSLKSSLFLSSVLSLVLQEKRRRVYSVKSLVIITANVQAFVLLGASSIRRPRRRMLDVVTKDKNLFCCSIVNVKLGQKVE